MRTITVDEARAELPRVLEEVEAGAEVLIARGEKPVARLVPITGVTSQRRPKVGTLRGAPFQIPDAAFAALSPDELKEWGL
jgi:prevent-host-death family protein